MSDSDFLANFVNKEVQYRFAGKELRFQLSQSLFSSFDIDEGTRLLMKSIAQEVKLDEVSSLLDIGCGVGIIGITLKKCRPQMEVALQDRDALALAFAGENASLNQVRNIQLVGGLALHHATGHRYDLIGSNLPGKAGQPVLRDIIERIPNHLTAGGRAVVVIVNPLADLVRNVLDDMDFNILYESVARGHSVFHFSGDSRQPAAPPNLEPYIRGRFEFKLGRRTWEMQTVYGIPEFDTLGHHTALALGVMTGKQISGRVLFWNPGQGHFPVHFAMDPNTSLSEYVLAGRDSLGLRVSASNLLQHGVDRDSITLNHLPHFLSLEGSFDHIILSPDPDPGVPWEKVLLQRCQTHLNLGGSALVTANSSFMHRLLATQFGLHKAVDKKRHGFRSVLLERPQ